MPPIHFINLLFVLITMPMTTHTHNLNLGQASSSKFDPLKMSDQFSKNPALTSSERGTLDNSGDFVFPEEPHSFPRRLPKGYASKYKLFLPIPTLGRKQHRNRIMRERMSNEIKDSFQIPYPFSRYTMLGNAIPNLPRKPWPMKDNVAVYLDKMRKVKAIKQALRMLDKKERAKLALLKTAGKFRNKEFMVQNGNVEQAGRPMQFRRAKSYMHSKTLQNTRDKPSTLFIDTPAAVGFDSKSNFGFPEGDFSEGAPLPANKAIRLPPGAMEYGLDILRHKTKPPVHANDVLYVKSPSKFIHSPYSSLTSPKLFSSIAPRPAAPPSNSDLEVPGLEVPGFPTAWNPLARSSYDSSPIQPGRVFVDMPDSTYHSSFNPAPSEAFSDFNDGFHSLPVPLTADGKTDAEVLDFNDGFSSDLGSWGDGGFDNDDNDCTDIETKSCQSSLDCVCFGFYTCTEGKCQSKQSNSEATAAQPAMDDWHDSPVDFGHFKRNLGMFGDKRSNIRHASSRSSRVGRLHRKNPLFHK